MQDVPWKYSARLVELSLYSGRVAVRLGAAGGQTPTPHREGGPPDLSPRTNQVIVDRILVSEN